MSNLTETPFQPKVSIVIPVYNGAEFMREAIDSALAQTYPHIEVIVVNDGSRDDGATREIALSYGDRIRYFEKENGGVSSALNLGIRNMTGDYFSWLSHDDVYLPDKVLTSVRYLESFADRERVIAFCGSSHINVRSEVIREEVERFERDRTYTGREVLRHLLVNHMMNMCCMLIPRTAFEECEPFHEGLRYNQDALMLYRIFSAGYRMVAHKRPTGVLPPPRQPDLQDPQRSSASRFPRGRRVDRSRVRVSEYQGYKLPAPVRRPSGQTGL
jgi:glycosyltransferase involved in cell wall biosynthesis